MNPATCDGSVTKQVVGQTEGMETESAQVFFALLTVLAMAIVVLAWGAALFGRTNSTLAQLTSDLDKVGVVLAWMVATTCMVGSLYFSEVANYEPCRLCWYQRVCMYSLAIILLVAVIRRSRDVVPYAVALALVGSCISIYHYLVEWYPSLESDVCDINVPCTTVWFRRFGFISLPLMALVGFVTVISVLVAPIVGASKEVKTKR